MYHGWMKLTTQTIYTLTLLMFIGSATAGEVKIWRQATEKDFSEGTLTRTVVDSNSTVSLSQQIDPQVDLEVEIVWSLCKAPDGTLIAATGNPGSVVRIDKHGKREVLHHADEQQFFAVTVDANGVVYAGESPSGKIYAYHPESSKESKQALADLQEKRKSLQEKYGARHPEVVQTEAAIQRLKADGRRELFATGESYIWALAVDNAGHLYAATGPNGKVFKITPDGKAENILTVKQPHVLSLALGASGILYAGTSKDGLVYKHTPPDSNYVLLDADQSDIQALLLAGDGILYVGTGSPSRPKLPGNTIQNKSSDNLGADLTTPPRGLQMQAEDPDEGKTQALVDTGTSLSPESRTGASGSRGSSSSPPASGDNSVYQIAPDGVVKEVFREKVTILSLALQGEQLLIGTGQEGRLYSLSTGDLVQGEIARLEHGQISQLVSTDAGSIAIGASTPGKIYRLEDRFASTGTFLSKVLDAKMQTRWGASQWRVAEPPGTQISVAVRTGNTQEPDDTWSDWVAESAKLPLGRFFQYQVTFKSDHGDASASLSDFVLYYATINQPPVIESIEVPQLATSPVANASDKIKLKWKASDPNSDTLSYTIEVKKEEWPDWIKISEDNLAKTELDWDPASMPSGSYLVRVSASDQAHNRQEEAMTTRKTSEAFIVDRDPPFTKIESVKANNQQYLVRVLGRDELSRLAGASYSINGKPWQPLLPDDGLFDGREEQITFTTEELTGVPHLLMVRFQDSAGHFGVADTVLGGP